MKIFYSFLVGLFFISTSVCCQELSSSSRALKENMPETYQAIKAYAINQWENDHSMILYEINKQSEAFVEVSNLSQENPAIFSNAVVQWGENITNENLLKNSTIDWSMVLYEMKKQIQAKNSY